MNKKIIHGVEVSDVIVELDFSANGAPAFPRVWFKVNGLQTLECLKKADDGVFFVERCDTWESTHEHGALVAITGLDDNAYDEFLDELHDYLDGIVFEQSQEAMCTNSTCFELRFCKYGCMPPVGGTGSTLDACILCAQEIKELEFYMREQRPLRSERYYIAQCGTHLVFKRF